MQRTGRLDRECGDDYVIDHFCPEDAPAITAGFKIVYGDHYLSAAVYDPDYFVKANHDGVLRSYVARDRSGLVVGHLAMARSAPFDGLREVAQGIVLPEHRQAGLLSRLIYHLIGEAERTPGCCGLFGTALTNHTISQRALSKTGFQDIGFEIDYVPARMFDQEGSANGAVATVIQYLPVRRERWYPVHLPPLYADLLTSILRRLGESRRFQPTAEALPTGRISALEMIDLPRFDMTRLFVRSAASDLDDEITSLERQARASGRRMLQVVLDLGNPACGPAVGLLRDRGYWLGGLLPRWFDADGLLLQKSLDQPNFPAIETYSEDAGVLLQVIQDDCATAPDGLNRAA